MIDVETKLRQFRRELHPKVSQEKLAQAAGVSRQWYHLLETGKQEHVSYTTAHAILRAINAERLSRNLEALSLDQLGMKIV